MDFVLQSFPGSRQNEARRSYVSHSHQNQMKSLTLLVSQHLEVKILQAQAGDFGTRGIH